MVKVKNEFYCRKCSHFAETEHREFECPKCESEDVFNQKYRVCDCGEKVYLFSHTNSCLTCGKFYNAFGQELLPPDEWDEKDREELLGPQNVADDDL